MSRRKKKRIPPPQVSVSAMCERERGSVCAGRIPPRSEAALAGRDVRP